MRGAERNGDAVLSLHAQNVHRPAAPGEVCAGRPRVQAGAASAQPLLCRECILPYFDAGAVEF